MPAGWQQGLTVVPDHLKGLLVDEMTPAYLRQTFLLGVPLGAAWVGAPGDAAMQQMLNAAIADVQGRLGIRFQIQRILTDPDPGKILGVDYEILGERLHYFRPRQGETHYFLPLPYAHVTSIQRVRLFFGDQLMATIPAPWIRFTSKEGVLRILPNAQVPLENPGHPNVTMLQNYVARDEVPDVWSIDYTIGHGRIDYDIAQYIGLSAAINVLAAASSGPAGADGTGGSGGVASESLSQDGITESVTYITGKYGMYSGIIQTMMDTRSGIDLDRKRAEKKGIKIAVV